MAVHLIAALAIAIGTGTSDRSVTSRQAANPSLQLPRFVFLQKPGPGGGGGGGGARQQAPPSRAKAVGQDQLTVPARRHVVSDIVTADVPPAESQQVVLEARPLLSGTTFMAGLPDAAASSSPSQGPGSGGGAGDGRGSGMGSGFGSGLGLGYGGGYGGQVFGPGSGVTVPRLLKQVKPKYTAEALQFKIQGTVVLTAVIGTDGVPGSVRILRSLDPGLDQEAIAAAREWRFTPGRIGTTPVNTLVKIEIEFHIV